MNAATLKIETSTDGSRCLTGRLNFGLEAGAILVLRKKTPTEWELRAVSGDGRRILNTPETLGSFLDIPRQQELFT